MFKNNKPKIILLILAFLVLIFIIFNINSKNNKKDLQKTKNIITNTPPPTPEIKQEKISLITNVNQYSKSELVGINRKNGNLILYTNGVEKVLYTGSVKSYDVQGSIVIILDEKISDHITIIDTEKNTKKSIALPDSPIISVALSNDREKIYFLGNFSISNKKPSINSISINGENHIKIGETYAQNIKYLNESTLLLFQDNHHEDKGSLSFYDIKKATTILTTNCNTFLTSPDKKYVSTKSTNKIEIINSDTLNIKTFLTPPSNRHIWKDEETVIVFQNNDGSINYSILDIVNQKMSPFSILKSNSNIQNPIGFIENKFIWQDYNEKFLSIEL